MKRLIYVSFENSENRASGVNKKISGQMEAFENRGYTVDLVAVHGKDVACFRGMKAPEIIHSKSLARIALCSWVSNHSQDYSIAYIRFQFFCPFVLNMVKSLHRNNVKVIMEIPTYPYVNELRAQGLKGIPKRLIDSSFGSRCAKYIDSFVSPLYGGNILGKKSIEICNGIDIGKINPRKPIQDNNIDLLAVAMMAPWHGYDRIIEGIHQYYKKNGERNIILHLVGEGAATPEYQKLIEKYSLNKHVMQHGRKSGQELDEIYDVADIGVGSLATVLKKIYKTNTLKVLEYMAKGLPVICEEGEVGIPKNSRYRLTVHSNQTAVDMEEVVSFYDSIYSTEAPVDSVIDEIRNYCRDNCSVEASLKGVFDFLDSTDK